MHTSTEVKAPSFDKEWEGLIKASNAALDSGQLERAIALNSKALIVAENNFSQSPISMSTVAAVLVSYHNLSDLHVFNGDLREAKKNLELAISYVEQFAQEELEAEEFEAICWGRATAYQQLWLFEKQHRH